MVPYVRMSFWKHFKDGLKYIENIEEPITLDGKAEDISINSTGYLTCPKAYQYAIDMTKRELDQAVEGMYHNLK